MTCEHRAKHGLTGLCAQCEDARHAAMHTVAVDGCMACKLSSLQWSPATHPSAYNSVPPKVEPPSWENGIVTSPRPDGSAMPVLDKNLNQIGVKELAHRRHEVTDGLRALHNS